MSAMMRNGVTVEATVASVRAAQPPGYVTYTFNAPFVAALAGRTVAYDPGQTVHLTATQATTLLALNAKMVLVA